jgi:peroxiredoxin
MTETASTMLALGTKAPEFYLPDVITGEEISLDTFAEKKALLVMFICRHCPYVVYVREELVKLGREFEDTALGIVAISANDPQSHPDDAPERLAEMARELGFVFPLCFDETQLTAHAYTAACTPDFFLFDERRELIYRGQLDDSRPGNYYPINGADLRAAIEAALGDQEVPFAQKPSIGCNIKWRPGNEPSYFG